MSKTVVAIVIYNRLNNLTHWLDCWQKCSSDAELVIIHNFDKEMTEYRQASELAGATYIRRKNIGYDIGAFQDVCKGRLDGFPEWEKLLWLTDDTMIMATDFVEQFERAMRPGVGVVAMEISPHVTKHIRTTGFMIDRATASKLHFPADPIITKQHCYLFEHRNNKKIFYNQVKEMGREVVMVAQRDRSPLWDTGYHRRLDRKAEHEAKFGELKTYDKVLFICPVFKTYPQIISSLILQTHQNWKLLLIHDGPDTFGVEKLVPKDDRIVFQATKKRGGSWGHYIRQVALEQCQDDADFVTITNADNYYTPVYCQYMIKEFERRPKAVAVYCEKIIHSYTAWKVMDQKLQVGFLDCGGVMLKLKEAAAVGWKDISTHSADWIFFKDVIDRYGADRFYKVGGCLFVHN